MIGLIAILTAKTDNLLLQLKAYHNKAISRRVILKPCVLRGAFLWLNANLPDF